MGESFFLRAGVVALAVQRVLRLIKISGKEEDYQNQGFSICVIKNGEIMLNENVREDDWPDIFTNDFQVIAERKAKTSFREKKDLSTLINEYPARLEEGDPIWPGAVYSGRCQIAIGVSGFAKAESDEGIARLISFIPKRN